MSDAPPYLSLPEPDTARSGRTGWVRAHWEAVADHLLDAVAPYVTAGGAQVRLPGRASRSGVVSDGLEGFARTFLLAAFRIAGAYRSDAGVPAGVDRLVERYAAGVAAGTDPAGPGRWPSIVDRSQQMVEAASIALALHETRPWIFDRLERSTQDNVRRWLGGFVGRRTWDNNWVMFQVVTEQFLSDVDGPYRTDDIERGLDRVEDWYRGDGWYSDGAGDHFDYYVGWAMHLYPLLWARMSGDTGRGDVYRQRLRAFLEQYQHFFGSAGAPVHQGRSLTYRFACTAPLWLGALCDATPLPPGRTRRLASGALRHFVEHGVPDGRGLLTLGWHAPFLPATQDYSGPCSPYWASKAFLGLLLPPDHPVWTEPEEPAPNDLGDTVVAMPAPGFVVASTVHDGVVRLLNHGSGHNPPPPAPAADDPHYAKLAYSTHTAPETSAAGWALDVDNHVALVAPDGTASRRTRLHRVAVADRYAASWHTATLGPDRYRVETAAVARGAWELRAHRIGGPAGPGVRDGGHAVADRTGPVVTVGDGWASAVRSDGLCSAVVGLHGWAAAGARTDAEANAFGPRSATPYLTAPAHPGGDAVYVSLVVLSGDAVHPDALRAAFAVSVAGRDVVVRYPDGELVRLRLGDPTPGYLRVPAGGTPVSHP